MIAQTHSPRTQNHNRPISLKYRVGDWVVQGVIPEHHLRIIRSLVYPNGREGWYQIFDTTLTRGYADYEWRPAAEIEKGSRLIQHAVGDEHLLSILQLCAKAQYAKYSIPERQDCESLQRWIHTGGLEKHRWSTQVWGSIAIVAVAVAYTAFTKEGRR